MLQFAESIWLWAAAGIIVPVIIHLWNVKEGKTLKVGSIAFLTESAKSHAKSFKLSELLLLLLRCLLLIVLAMLIAKPYYEKALDQPKEKGWILIGKNEVHEVYKKFQLTIDTLLKAGYTFHYFDPGFEEDNLSKILKLPADTTKKSAVSYWQLLKELDQKVPSKLPVQLFTDNSLSSFSSERPAVSMNLNWNIYTSTDTISTCIKRAYKTIDDSIRIIVSNSTSTGTYYTHQSISASKTNNKFSLKIINGSLFVTSNDTVNASCNNPVEVDTSTMVVAIFPGKNKQDANYLSAALDAVKDFTKYKIKVLVTDNVQHIPVNYNWLFWLSEETIPAAIIRNNVFMYEKGKVDNLHSAIIARQNVSSADNDVTLFKSIKANENDTVLSETIWKNGFGTPILNRQKKIGLIYHFYSRFDPQWNDLTWSNKFPEIIYNLIFPEEKDIPSSNASDKRIMDASQIQPIITDNESITQKQDLTDKRDLSKVWWIIAFVLFIIERIASMQLKKEEAYA